MGWRVLPLSLLVISAARGLVGAWGGPVGGGALLKIWGMWEGGRGGGG